MVHHARAKVPRCTPGRLKTRCASPCNCANSRLRQRHCTSTNSTHAQHSRLRSLAPPQPRRHLRLISTSTPVRSTVIAKMPALTVNNISGASRKRSRRAEAAASDDDADEDELVDIRQASSQLRSEPVCSAACPHSVNRLPGSSASTTHGTNLNPRLT